MRTLILVLCLWTGPDASDRIDAITCRIASLYRQGRIDSITYTILFDLRSKAHRAVLRWMHGGPAHEPAAREAMDKLEVLLP